MRKQWIPGHFFLGRSGPGYEATVGGEGLKDLLCLGTNWYQLRVMQKTRACNGKPKTQSC